MASAGDSGLQFSPDNEKQRADPTLKAGQSGQPGINAFLFYDEIFEAATASIGMTVTFTISG